MQRQDHTADAEVFDVDLEEYELHALSHFLGLKLRVTPAVAAALAPLLTARPATQTYFFARFIDLSNLNRGYDQALATTCTMSTRPQPGCLGTASYFWPLCYAQTLPPARPRWPGF